MGSLRKKSRLGEVSRRAGRQKQWNRYSRPLLLPPSMNLRKQNAMKSFNALRLPTQVLFFGLMDPSICLVLKHTNQPKEMGSGSWWNITLKSRGRSWNRTQEPSE